MGKAILAACLISALFVLGRETMRLRVACFSVVALAVLAGTCQAEDHSKAWMEYLVGKWIGEHVTPGGNGVHELSIEKTDLETVLSARAVRPNGEIEMIGLYVWDKDGSGSIRVAWGSPSNAGAYEYDMATEDKLLVGATKGGYHKIDANNWEIRKADGTVLIKLARKKK
jgi:hypothetical protein